METVSYAIDLSNALAGSSGLYRDARHQNRKGVQALAETILEELEARGIIDALSTASQDPP